MNEPPGDILVRHCARRPGYDVTLHCHVCNGQAALHLGSLVARGHGDLTLQEVLEKARCAGCKRAQRRQGSIGLTVRWTNVGNRHVIGRPLLLSRP